MVSVLIAWLVFQKELDQKGHKIKVSITYSLLLRKKTQNLKEILKLKSSVKIHSDEIKKTL